jgi:hypothetical protein
MTDEKISIGERYAVASGSSNLRCGGEAHRGDIDVVMAAGFAGETAGKILSRARNEFDDAHATIPEDVGATNRRMLAVMRMASLSAAKRVVNDFALVRAERYSLPMYDDECAKLAWQALSVYLDPSCSSCSGRGFSGGYDGPTLRCTHCRETGKRRGFVGNSDSQRAFVEALIGRIENEVNGFQVETERRLRA